MQVWMLRRPLISDGAEEKALLRGVEDGSPTRAVAKPLRRDGVSGRNAVRCDAQKLLYQAHLRRARCPHIQFQPSVPRAAFFRGRALCKPWKPKPLTGMLNKKKPPALFLHDSE
ncbi:hypothetical protein B0H13DRAFT_1913413 [Mycena leptocephala]|nr:hypothetical protein B0H13DRAFT_1913413 [Mycena leptocephala]